MDALYWRFFPHDGDALVGYHRALQSRLRETGRVLDLGCGDNRELADYRVAGREVWGTDFQTHPDLAHPEWFRPLRADGTAPFPSEAFDLIAGCWVLEHVEEPVRFLAEVRRLLRPGGAFVAVTVNAAHYVTWIKRFFSLLPHRVTQELVQRLYGRPQHDTFPTRYRLNTPNQMHRAARRAGLRVAEIVPFANPDYFSFSPLLRRCALMTDWALEFLGGGLGRLYLVATFEKSGAANKEAMPVRRVA
jgi:SAM-dependent methyltransferase